MKYPAFSISTSIWNSCTVLSQASGPHSVGSEGLSSTLSVSLLLFQGLPNLLLISWAPLEGLLHKLFLFLLSCWIAAMVLRSSTEMLLWTSLWDRHYVIVINTSSSCFYSVLKDFFVQYTPFCSAMPVISLPNQFLGHQAFLYQQILSGGLLPVPDRPAESSPISYLVLILQHTAGV